MAHWRRFHGENAARFTLVGDSMTRFHSRTAALATVIVALLAVVAFPIAVEAGALKANVYLTQHKIPAKLTEKGLIGFVRSHHASRLRESSEEKIEERKFMAEMVTQFSQPPGDLEFHVLFYDIHEGSRQFVEDMSTFIDDRKQKVFLQRVKLPRPRFKPNRRMELVVTVKRAEVGSLKFITDGEEKRHSGVVSFEDEKK
jgi:hypothetical protein